MDGKFLHLIVNSSTDVRNKTGNGYRNETKWSRLPKWLCFWVEGRNYEQTESICVASIQL